MKNKPASSTPPYPQHQLLMPDSHLDWVPALTRSHDEQWCESLGTINPFLSKLLWSWCSSTATVTLRNTASMQSQDQSRASSCWGPSWLSQTLQGQRRWGRSYPTGPGGRVLLDVWVRIPACRSEALYSYCFQAPGFPVVWFQQPRPAGQPLKDPTASCYCQVDSGVLSPQLRCSVSSNFGLAYRLKPLGMDSPPLPSLNALVFEAPQSHPPAHRVLFCSVKSLEPGMAPHSLLSSVVSNSSLWASKSIRNRRWKKNEINGSSFVNFQALQKKTCKRIVMKIYVTTNVQKLLKLFITKWESTQYSRHFPQSHCHY